MAQIGTTTQNGTVVPVDIPAWMLQSPSSTQPTSTPTQTTTTTQAPTQTQTQQTTTTGSSGYNINSRGEDINPYKSSTPTPAQGTVLPPASATQTNTEQPAQQENQQTTTTATGAGSNYVYEQAPKVASVSLADYGLNKPYATSVNQYGEITFKAGMSSQQKDSILSLVNTKPVSQWTTEDKNNWNYATNNAILPTPKGGTILDTSIDNVIKAEDLTMQDQLGSLPVATAPTFDTSKINKYLTDAEQAKLDYSTRLKNYYSGAIGTEESQLEKTRNAMWDVNGELTSAMNEYKDLTTKYNLIGNLENINWIQNQMMEETRSLTSSMDELNGGTPSPSGKYREYTMLNKYNARIASLGTSLTKIKEGTEAAQGLANGYYDNILQGLQQKQSNLQTLMTLSENNLVRLDAKESEALKYQMASIDEAASYAKEQRDIQNSVTASPAYSLAVKKYGLSLDDDVYTQKRKIGMAENDQKMIQALQASYLDAGISENDTMEEASKKASKSAKWINDTTKSSSDDNKMTTNQMFNTALQLYNTDPYTYKTVWDALSVVEAMNNGTMPFVGTDKTTYGSTTGTNKPISKELQDIGQSLSSNPTLTEPDRQSMNKEFANLLSNGEYEQFVDSYIAKFSQSLPTTKAGDEYKDAYLSYEYANRMESLLKQAQAKGINFNAIRDYVNDISTTIQGWNNYTQEEQSLVTEMKQVFFQYRNQLTGAAFGAGESKSYESVVPSAGKTVELNLNLISGFRNVAEQKMKSLQTLYGGGANYYNTLKDVKMANQSYRIYDGAYQKSGMNEKDAYASTVAKMSLEGLRTDAIPSVKGGQCGVFTGEVFGNPKVGDTLSTKKSSIDNALNKIVAGQGNTKWTSYKTGDRNFSVGDVIVTNENPESGHVAAISAILPDGSIRLIESNYFGDEMITGYRILNPEQQKKYVYGAFRKMNSSSEVTKTQKSANYYQP